MYLIEVIRQTSFVCEGNVAQVLMAFGLPLLLDDVTRRCKDIKKYLENRMTHACKVNFLEFCKCC